MIKEKAYLFIRQYSPFLFVDEIRRMDLCEIETSKSIKGDEWYFKGHFPGKPIMPACLAGECIYQAGSALGSQYYDMRKAHILVGRVYWAKYLVPILPPATLEIKVHLKDRLDYILTLDGQLSVGGNTCIVNSFSLCYLKSE